MYSIYYDSSACTEYLHSNSLPNHLTWQIAVQIESEKQCGGRPQRVDVVARHWAVVAELQGAWGFRPWEKPYCWSGGPGRVEMVATFPRKCSRCRRWISRGDWHCYFPATQAAVHPLCDLLLHGVEIEEARREVARSRRRRLTR